MRFTELALPGVYLLEPEQLQDDRGFFARTFCVAEFQDRGLVAGFAQASISFNRLRGTVRGLHYSVGPNAETKVIRCTAGSIYDIILDLRPTSVSYRRHLALELSADNHRSLYVPRGVAHGFQTLVDDTEVLYMIDPAYDAEAARGVRWSDPSFDVEWHQPISVMSDKDRNFPAFDP